MELLRNVLARIRWLDEVASGQDQLLRLCHLDQTDEMSAARESLPTLVQPDKGDAGSSGEAGGDLLAGIARLDETLDGFHVPTVPPSYAKRNL